MRAAHRVADIRAAEAALIAGLRRAGQGEDALMQRAATGLAAGCAALLGRVYGARVVLLVGSGDNGGDALFAGARLARRGARVDALPLTPDRVHARGLAALRLAGGRVADGAGVLQRADLVLDGIVGIGASGGLRPAAAELAERAAAGPGLLVAVDLPSGVDADTGEVPGPAVRADATVTFGTWKPALLVDPAAGLAGASTLVDIGLAGYLPSPAAVALQDADVAALLPRPRRDADKYRRGVLGICAGSATYPGAAVLAVAGAMHAGTGMVRFAGPEPAAAAVRARWPEAVVTTGAPSDAGRVQAWVVGPGMGTDDTARARLHDILRSEVPVVVDADALTLLTGAAPLRRGAPTLLTPHAGELGRLVQKDPAEVERTRIACARLAADRYGATVLLKGSTTVVTAADGPAYVNPTGSGWLATAGSGDVLAGLAGSLLASGLDAAQAGAVAAYLHGAAARVPAAGAAPLTALGLAASLPAAWRGITAG